MASRGKGAPLLRSPARPTSRHAEESEAEQQRRMVQDKGLKKERKKKREFLSERNVFFGEKKI